MTNNDVQKGLLFLRRSLSCHTNGIGVFRAAFHTNLYITHRILCIRVLGRKAVVHGMVTLYTESIVTKYKLKYKL